MLLYRYFAKLVRVVDGDTVFLEVDCGFHIKLTEKFRLAGINAPEMKGETKEKGQAAKDYLESLIAGKQLYIETEKSLDKFGRWLCYIEVDGVDINEKMADDGHAVPFMEKAHE